MASLRDRVRRQWEALGASDPYWGVLTHPSKKGGKWDKDEFFRSGVDEIAEVEAKLAKLGVTIDRCVALDFGCGVGRLSRALAQRFDRVIGVDISESMLAEARNANRDVANIEFVRGSGADLASLASSSVDLIYSNIVLQHSPPALQRSLIKEFCRVVRPGGAVVFQIPSHANRRNLNGLVHALFSNRVLNVARRLVNGKERVLEMHALRRRAVERLLRDAGMQLVEVERFDSAGPAFVSFRYFAKRS